MPKCTVCFRECELTEGKVGFCGARMCKDGKITAKNYGRLTSLALDPIEKKPLRRFYPGSIILSVGSYGCNLRCPFCQNYDISWSEQAMRYERTARVITPEELADTAACYKRDGNIGAAFTYNEPLVGYEFIRDAAKLIHENGMKNVLVTNGTASLEVLGEIMPYIDAMNIDLKGFSESYYRRVLGGNLKMTLDFIEQAVKSCHVEITTLIVPGENDTEDEIKEISSFIAGLKDLRGNTVGSNIPLHISRFFPRFKMTDRAPTDVGLIYSLAETARKNLKYVYTGNC